MSIQAAQIQWSCRTQAHHHIPGARNNVLFHDPRPNPLDRRAVSPVPSS
jgi:hypothetical protein